MTRVDLVTGFLGAGKTTFLLRWGEYLLEKGEKLAILVYDHGAVNVDLPLLQSLRERGCEIETLAGACDADCHRRRFRTKLISLAMRGFDRVLIEPSGVFDMDEYFDALYDAPLDRWYEPGSVVAILDARLEPEGSAEEDFFLASQICTAGCVVLSRVPLAAEGETEAALARLRRAEAAIHAPLTPDSRVLKKDWAALTEADFRRLDRCGYHPADYVKTLAGRRPSFQALSYLELPDGREALEAKARALFSEPGYGHVLRVKGFFAENGGFFCLNATERECRVESASQSRPVVTVIGSDLNEDAVALLLTGEKPKLHLL